MQKIKADVFSPIQNESIAQSVVRQIEEALLSGVLIEGGKLPTERELAAQLMYRALKLETPYKSLKKEN